MAAAPLAAPSGACDEDGLIGSVDLMLSATPEQLSTPDEVERLFRSHLTSAHQGEFNIKSGTNSWRMAARLCCVQTDVWNPPGLTKARAISLIQGLLGKEYCPPSETLEKNAPSGYWIVAVALSLMLKKLVSPARARACFIRKSNQGFKLSEYGTRLLERHSVSWPPHPEFAYSWVDETPGIDFGVILMERELLPIPDIA